MVALHSRLDYATEYVTMVMNLPITSPAHPQDTEDVVVRSDWESYSQVESQVTAAPHGVCRREDADQLAGLLSPWIHSGKCV